MGFIIGLLKIIILLGFLVLIHEGGHFLVAKKCGVKVLEFSIGFGKEIWSKQKGETKYSIRLVPLRTDFVECFESQNTLKKKEHLIKLQFGKDY